MNHSKSCRCGFGGDGHLGRSPGFPPGVRPVTPTRPIISGVFDFSNNNSYVIPNARCPECGDLVFFLKLKNGGRVFFDEIGPPWPKHPCTDYLQNKKYDSHNFYRGSVSINYSTKKEKVVKEVWTPMIIVRNLRVRYLIRYFTDLYLYPNGKNLWITLTLPLEKHLNNKDVIFLFKRKYNDIKICWFDLSSYTNGEIKGKVLNNF